MEEWSSNAEQEFDKKMRKLATLNGLCHTRRVKLAKRLLKYR
jgi:hypothetical protein